MGARRRPDRFYPRFAPFEEGAPGPRFMPIVLALVLAC
jgi:hypothetical protein